MPRLGLLLGLLLALPATASAATTYYVSSSGSGAVCSQAAPCATIATAVGKAVDDDTISIAPGTFSDPVDTTKRLTFTGAGPGTAGGADGSTFIDIPGEGGAPAMRLRNGGTVTHMRLRGQSLVNSSSCCGGPGLQVAPDPGPNGIVYTVADVIAIGGKNIAGAAGVSVSNGAAPQRVFSLSVNDGVLVSDEDGLVINATTGYIDREHLLHVGSAAARRAVRHSHR